MSARGTYALLLYLDAPRAIRVGALGEVDLAPGWYLYTGSAHGPGGLPARLARHRRREGKRFHWHIDYLRAVAALIEVWSCQDAVRRECDWAAASAALPGACAVVPRFGASDCGCAAHLFYYPRRPAYEAFVEQVRARVSREHVDRGESP